MISSMNKSDAKETLNSARDSVDRSQGYGFQFPKQKPITLQLPISIGQQIKCVIKADLSLYKGETGE